jgi:two-component system response regulator PilR (NtrC family)
VLKNIGQENMKAECKILVVDDEEMLRNLLVKILVKEGYDVDTAENGEEALDKLSQAPYDLLISDIKMPKMNGFELLKNVRSKYPLVGVIIMTAYGDSYSVKDALLLGADEYITKPFKSFEINLIVERAYWRLMSGRGNISKEG